MVLCAFLSETNWDLQARSVCEAIKSAISGMKRWTNFFELVRLVGVVQETGGLSGSIDCRTTCFGLTWIFPQSPKFHRNCKLRDYFIAFPLPVFCFGDDPTQSFSSCLFKVSTFCGWSFPSYAVGYLLRLRDVVLPVADCLRNRRCYSHPRDRLLPMMNFVFAFVDFSHDLLCGSLRRGLLTCT